MSEKPKRFVFDLAAEDREALERVRVKLGARSHAEALRKLIGAADDRVTIQHIPPGRVAWPSGALLLPEHTEDPGLNAKAWLSDTSRAKVTDPGMGKPLKSHFRPNPKPGKK